MNVEQKARAFIESQFLIDNLQIEKHMIDAYSAGHADALAATSSRQQLRFEMVREYAKACFAGTCAKVDREAINFPAPTVIVDGAVTLVDAVLKWHDEENQGKEKGGA